MTAAPKCLLVEFRKLYAEDMSRKGLFLVLWLMINRHASFCNGSAALKRFLVPHWEIAWRHSTFLVFKLSLKRLLARYHDGMVEPEFFFIHLIFVGVTSAFLLHADASVQCRN